MGTGNPFCNNCPTRIIRICMGYWIEWITKIYWEYVGMYLVQCTCMFHFILFWLGINNLIHLCLPKVPSQLLLFACGFLKNLGFKKSWSIPKYVSPQSFNLSLHYRFQRLGTWSVLCFLLTSALLFLVKRLDLSESR